ncbi:hypothetical protein EXIGLDRAFT_699361 [Exidia glandulosa HHB12029]|uniref:Uncharacterized protein n=1 Tax=Exidia glandulosa HHB12029 TaxID=1314781 RepID=A0A165DXW8_EXIGL|nr:hypothetical protein EXIGLDRAFT_699361 [Exidia glandulosa HHB12029]
MLVEPFFSGALAAAPELQDNYCSVARAPSLLRSVHRGRRGCVLYRGYQHLLTFANQAPDRLENTSPKIRRFTSPVPLDYALAIPATGRHTLQHPIRALWISVQPKFVDVVARGDDRCLMATATACRIRFAHAGTVPDVKSDSCFRMSPRETAKSGITVVAQWVCADDLAGNKVGAGYIVHRTYLELLRTHSHEERTANYNRAISRDEDHIVPPYLATPAFEPPSPFYGYGELAGAIDATYDQDAGVPYASDESHPSGSASGVRTNDEEATPALDDDVAGNPWGDLLTFGGLPFTDEEAEVLTSALALGEALYA